MVIPTAERLRGHLLTCEDFTVSGNHGPDDRSEGTGTAVP
jgi:hypothetical protein